MHDAKVIGMDSETWSGPPITLQLYSEDVPSITAILWVYNKNPTEIFFKHLRKLRRGRYRMYGHNLPFDLVSLLWAHLPMLADGSLNATLYGWTVSGRYGHPSFLSLERDGVIIDVVDAMLWFSSTLERAAEIVCPGLPKLARPRGLGEKLFKKSDDEFCAYAMRDAEVSFHQGKAIERMHADEGIEQTYSLASMAARIFQQRYQRETIYQPPSKEWMAGSLASYHGGVNRVRREAAPGWHANVNGWDLSSAYPAAMRNFPSFCNASLYKSARGNKFKIDSATALGVYKVSGVARECDWPALFDHNFEPIQGKFTDVWVHGYELTAAIEANEVSVKSFKGFFYDHESDTKPSPFKGFVDDKYLAKSTAEDPVIRHKEKITMNGVTGKFIQTQVDHIRINDRLVSLPRAGGLYHPFIASSITAHTRARIHGLEHKVEAIHTATDGVFADSKKKIKPGVGLGSVQLESKGDLALLRNKLYILYSDEPAKGSYPSKVFPGKHICKAARHGYQGTIFQLEEMIAHGHRHYSVTKPNQLKSSLKSGAIPNNFETKTRRLNVGPMRVMSGYQTKKAPHLSRQRGNR